MSDFLARMALRSQGAAPILRPRPLALFEGGAELFEEVHLEREVTPARRPAASPVAPPRAAVPPSSDRVAEAWPDPLPADRSETVPAHVARPPAPARIWTDPAETIESPRPPVPGEPAAAAVGVAPAPGAPPPPAATTSAAIVRRRGVEPPPAVAAEGEWSAPLAERASLAGRDPDPETPAFAPPSLAELPRREQARRGEPLGGRTPPASAPARDSATALPGAEAVPAPAPDRLPARPSDSAAGAAAPRSAPSGGAVAPAAVPATPGGQPFAPRAEAAPAPVEIRIGRIDIHAAPPAAPAAPAEAPGPSLDAFLARPRR